MCTSEEKNKAALILQNFFKKIRRKKHPNVLSFYLQMVKFKKIAQEVLSELGSGRLEKHYQQAMMYELRKSGYNISTEISRPIPYKDTYLDNCFGTTDIIVNKHIVIELKATGHLNKFSSAHVQCYNYIKDHKYDYGIVLNFVKSPTPLEKLKKKTIRPLECFLVYP